MRLLLDTHAVIWYYQDQSVLGKKALEAIENNANQLFISIASIWEMNIKAGTGKLKLDGSVMDIAFWYKSEGARLLSITEAHAHGVRLLPSIHRDPFDRMLVSQARNNKLTIVTVDENIRQYPVACLW